MVSIVADAQYRVSSIDRQDAENIKLHQVLETEDKVLVYGTFKSLDDGIHLFNLSRTTKVEKNHVSYKITNSVNLPLWNEAEPRYVQTTKPGDKVNFVMEFEKFDLSGTFDIVENENKHGAHMFNFYGIHLEKIEPKDAIDTKRFLDDGHVIFGRYKSDGRTYTYYIKDGLSFMYHDNWNDGDFIINLEITNNSDRGVMFDLAKVRQEGTDKNGKPVEVARYSPESYDKHIESSRRYNAQLQTTNDLTRAVGSKIFHERISATNEWAKLGLRALEEIYEQAQENRIQDYLKEHPDNSPKALRSNSIKPGESIAGYMAFKVKKCKKIKICVTMDDYDFDIVYNLNH